MLFRTSLKMMKSLKWNVCSCVFNCHESNFWIILLNPSSLPRSSSWISLFALLAVLVIAWYTAVPCFFFVQISKHLPHIDVIFRDKKSSCSENSGGAIMCLVAILDTSHLWAKYDTTTNYISYLGCCIWECVLKNFFSFTTAMNFKDHVFPKIKQSTFLSGLAHMDLQTFL